MSCKEFLVLFVILNFLDAALTHYGVGHLGMGEGNPVWKSMIETYPWSVWIMKPTLTALIAYGFYRFWEGSVAIRVVGHATLAVLAFVVIDWLLMIWVHL